MTTAELDPITIWTIGHSNLQLDEFVDLLRQYDIQTVVDVRSSPYSRFANQFNREPLKRHLEREGVAYQFEGGRLGGRPSDPDCYRGGALPDDAERHDYLKLVDYERVQQSPWFKEGLQVVVELAADQRIALMCSEEDPHKCHREHLIANALADIPHFTILHIRRTGQVEDSASTRETVASQLSLL